MFEGGGWYTAHFRLVHGWQGGGRHRGWTDREEGIQQCSLPLTSRMMHDPAQSTHSQGLSRPGRWQLGAGCQRRRGLPAAGAGVGWQVRSCALSKRLHAEGSGSGLVLNCKQCNRDGTLLSRAHGQRPVSLERRRLANKPLPGTARASKARTRGRGEDGEHGACDRARLGNSREVLCVVLRQLGRLPGSLLSRAFRVSGACRYRRCHATCRGRQKGSELHRQP